MKIVFLAACSAFCVSSALASFDMMLMPNFSNRVNRYDPVNGVNLGGFNSNNARQVTIDQTRGIAYAYDSSAARIRGYNYSTGESVGLAGAVSGVKALEYHAGINRVLSLTGTGISSSALGSTSAAVLTTLSAAVSWETMAIFGNVITVFGNSGVGSIAYESYNATTGANLGGGSFGTSLLAASSFGKATWISSPVSSNGYYVFTYVNASGNLLLARSNATAAGVAGVISSTTLSGFASSNVMPATVIGHNGFFIVGQSSTTATDTLVRKLDNVPSFPAEYTQTISGTTFTAGIYQAANVVAPEPGSMIALGLGVAALVRKRRNRV